MKKALKEIFKSTLCLVMLGLAWYGVHGNHTAFNIFKFVAIVSLVIDWLVAIARDGVRKSKPGSLVKPKASLYFAMTTDLLVALLLAGFGYFGYATIIIMQPMLEAYIYDEEKKPETAS